MLCSRYQQNDNRDIVKHVHIIPVFSIFNDGSLMTTFVGKYYGGCFPNIKSFQSPEVVQNIVSQTMASCVVYSYLQ
jgi:hypothetical protein